MLSTLQIGLENNALLRLMISQNVQIMQKLGIDREDMGSFGSITADLMPEGNQNPDDLVAALISSAEPIAGMLSLKTWQWAKINTGDHLESEEDE